MHAQDQLLALLDDHGIPCVILKGAAADMSYPHPVLRSMGDIDFLVKREDLEKAAGILEDNGFILSHDKNPKMHHYGYKKDGIDFELYWRVGSALEESLIRLFEDGIDSRLFAECEGYRFPVLPPDLNGLVFLFHINQHLRSGLGFRQIIDWMMYIHNYGIEQMQPLLEKTNTERFAFSVTSMCQNYLGLEKVVDEREDYPVDELMEYISGKGNFGRKAGIAGQTESFSLTVTNPVKLFKRLQAGGMSRFKAIKKYPFLTPFAWIYQIGYISRVLVKNKMTPKKVISHQKKGIEQRELIERLGLRINKEIGR